MKKIICMILIISILSALVFTANVFAEGETVTVDGITYTSYDTYCELTSCDYDKSDKVDIPSSVKFGGKSLPVTSIGMCAFDCCSGLTSVTIPDSVTSIGEGAFYCCSGLTSVTIGNGVTSICNYAFSECSGLTSVTIPDSVTTIGDYAFYNCSGLTSVTIGNGVTSIGEGAFSGCSGLESMTVSKNNKKYHSSGNCIIETGSKTLVAGCKNSVIPNDGSVTTISARAFYNCSSLTNVTIPDSVTSIGEGAFYNCSGLTSVTIGKSVTSIDEGVFYCCSCLTSVTIPDSVTSIAQSAFENCEELKNVYFGGTEEQWNKINIDENKNNVLFEAEIIFGKSATVTIDGITYTSNVGFCTLTKCDTNKSGKVTIPSSVNFDGNELPVKSIENQSFWFCKKITEVTIPDSVEYIANSAFFDCDSLENVTIGKNVSKIGVAAFVDCDSLASITVSKDNPVYRSSGNCLIETISKTLIVGCKNSVIPGDGSVTSIFKEAFESCIGLTSIIIPKSVTSIGRFAFFGCDNLKTVYYTGSEAEWNKISVDDYNDPLLNAEIIFNYVSEKGDINGDGAIDNKDVVVLFRYVSGGNKVTDESIYDINGDGEVDNKDVVTLFRFVSTAK